MAITIVATSGSATANSYATEAEVIAYMATRLNSGSWTTFAGSTATETEKKAMIEARRWLDPLPWEGRRVDDDQALSWPRQWALNPDSSTGNYYGNTVVPQRVKDAQSELAFQFVKAGTTDIAAEDTTLGVRRKKIDVIETEYFEPHMRLQRLKRYPRVWDLIRDLVAYSGVSTPVVRG